MNDKFNLCNNCYEKNEEKFYTPSSIFSINIYVIIFVFLLF